MAFHCDIDSDRHLGTLTFSGTLGAGELIEAMKALYNHPDWQPGFDALWDGLGITRLIIEPDDLALISEAYREVQAKMGRGRAAVVMAQDITHVISELLMHRLRNPDRERRTFTHLDEAVAWLNEEHR